MKSWGFALLLAFLLTGLASCATPVSKPDDFDRVEIAPGMVIALPSPGALGRSIEAVQLVTVQFDDRSLSFEGRIAIDPDRLLLVGTDLAGRRLMRIEWRAGQWHVEKSPEIPDQLSPARILADIALIYWPSPTLAATLAPDARLAETPGRRTLLHRNRPVIEIEIPIDNPWSGPSRLTNLGWQYVIDVQSRELTP